MKNNVWREGLKETADAIRSHPRFADSAFHFMVDYLQWRVRLGVHNKVISNLGRDRLIEHLMYLHFGRVDQGRGATFERLAALSESRDGIGSRAVRTALRLAQIAGLVLLTRDRSDARLRIYEPTETLLEMTREYFLIAFRILDDLAPQLRVCAQLRHEPGFLAWLLARMGRAYVEAGFDRNLAEAPLSQLLRLEGSRPVLGSAIDCHRRGAELPTALELSRRFYVSPSQSRVIMRTAETLGLVRTGPRGRLLDAKPLSDAYFEGLTRYLAFALRYGLGVEEKLFETAN